jgi:hypothetical protein
VAWAIVDASSHETVRKVLKKLWWQTELEKRFPQLLAGFHGLFWSSDRLIFTPFRKSAERE